MVNTEEGNQKSQRNSHSSVDILYNARKILELVVLHENDLKIIPFTEAIRNVPVRLYQRDY